MNRKLCIIANSLLLVWFFLDMFGLAVGNLVLVESAWKEIDGIWFLIFAGLFSLFCIKDKYGKYPMSIFLLLWIVTQFMSHWYYTIFGASESKIVGYNKWYAKTFRIVSASDTRVIPDLYHIVLHLLILSAFICMVQFCIQSRKKTHLK